MDHGATPQSGWSDRTRTIGCLALVVAFGFAFWVCFNAIVGHFPGGPATHWTLADGTRVGFYQMEHDPPGRDSIKVLEVARPGQSPQTYRFAEWHAGYSHVALHTNDAGDLIWLVDRRAGTVGCTLDLTTGIFSDEGDSPSRGIDAWSGILLKP